MFLQHADSRTTADRYIHTVDTAPQIRASAAVVHAICGAAKIELGRLSGIVMGHTRDEGAEAPAAGNGSGS